MSFEQLMAPGNARDDPVAAVSESGDAIVVRLAGELDLYNAPALRKALLECVARRPSRLVVDLAEVTFVDSTALGTLIEARARLGSAGELVLSRPGLETRPAPRNPGLHPHLAGRENPDDPA